MSGGLDFYVDKGHLLCLTGVNDDTFFSGMVADEDNIIKCASSNHFRDLSTLIIIITFEKRKVS